MTGQVLPSGTQRPVDQSKRLRILRFLGAGGIIGLLLTRPAWNEASVIHEMIEFIGVALVLLCVLGRLWSTLYVGGRKNTELVVTGPYSMSRNPLYLFSTLGSLGTGLMFGSIATAGLFGVTTYVVFFKTARQEEHYLRTRFGPA
ncbi:protein-S-isoprenylcysteine O-methyltransferase Ste14 [Sinorhizobium fredii]|uniref:methyltransferase family protein n=1 Tax=Rhizobium fredii TaxID=380 RepID=UPI00065E9E7A|nr:isoprenylcysteine carboxylmethyltransferase family protein [Sinorhizobium fredii]